MILTLLRDILKNFKDIPLFGLKKYSKAVDSSAVGEPQVL